jgi:type VI secretion system protein ImpE
MSKAKELLEEGKLQESIQAMNDEVKRNPADTQRRGFLAELLCVAGRLERADAQLEVILQQDTKAALGVALLRQLIRAETARRDFSTAGFPNSSTCRRRISSSISRPPSICARNARRTPSD